MYHVLNKLFGQKEGLSRMTGNLSRTVLRGAGARESACLPDETRKIKITTLLISELGL